LSDIVKTIPLETYGTQRFSPAQRHHWDRQSTGAETPVICGSTCASLSTKLAKIDVRNSLYLVLAQNDNSISIFLQNIPDLTTLTLPVLGANRLGSAWPLT
jgi:hypothetical protein